MTSLLLALLVATTPDGLDRRDEPPASTEPRVNVFGAPVSTAAVAGLLAAADLGGLYVPLGATFRVGPHWGLTAELQGSYLTGGSVEAPGWSVSASFGPTFFVTSETGLDGFFVTLRGGAQQVQAAKFPQTAHACFGPSSCAPVPPGNSHAFLVGVDAGYLWRFGALTVSLQLGAGVGYEENQASHFTFPVDPGSGFTSGFAWSLNLNFLRVGYAF